MYIPEKIIWSDAYSTGDAKIDFQHKYLFETLNRLGDLIQEGVDAERLRVVLGRLHFYLQWHFTHEENCMNHCSHSLIEDNKRDHQLFIKMVAGYLKDIENHERLNDLAVIIHSDLVRWFSDHIMKVDTQLKDSITQKE